MRVILNKEQYNKNCEARIAAILNKANYSATVGAKLFKYTFFAADGLGALSYEDIANKVKERSEGTVVEVKSTTRYILFEIVEP